MIIYLNYECDSKSYFESYRPLFSEVSDEVVVNQLINRVDSDVSWSITRLHVAEIVQFWHYPYIEETV